MSPGHRGVSAEVLRAFPGAPVGALPTLAFAELSQRAPVSLDDVDALVAFLRSEFAAMEAIGLRDVVVGLSGGLDSVVVVRLCQLASGSDRSVHTVTVDLGRPGDAERCVAAARCAAKLGVAHALVDGGAARAAVIAASPGRGPWSDINTDTRLIQDFLFRVADAAGASVASTADLSEKLLGRQTEAFYGQVEPLGTLYKTEARELGRVLGVLEFLTDSRPGCEDYWYDDEVLGVGYEVIDAVLYLLTVERLDAKAVATRIGMEDVAWVDRVKHRVDLQPLRLGTRGPG